MLDDKMTDPARVQFITENDGNALMSVVIMEGRKRQVRRMFDAVGHPVMRLTRVREGNITLARLPLGKHRDLTAAELKELRKEVGL